MNFVLEMYLGFEFLSGLCRVIFTSLDMDDGIWFQSLCTSQQSWFRAFPLWNFFF